MVKDIKIQKIIDNISKEIIDKLEPSGLVSLYLVGTILSKDRVHSSDIDFFGFVTKKFDIAKEEDKINNFLDKNKKNLCGGIECRFRAIGLDEIHGKKRGRISKFIGISEMVLTFPYWKLIYGKNVRLDKIAKPHSVTFRKGKVIRKLNFMIERIKSGEDYFLHHISKEVIRLAGIESEIAQKNKYTYYYNEIEKRFDRDKKHIVHKAMKFRKDVIFKKGDMLNFISEIEAYIKYMKGIKK